MQYAVVVAAGQGRRMGFKKQFLHLAGCPMWLRSVEAMFKGGAQHTVIVASPDDVIVMTESLQESEYSARCTLVIGGSTRHESVQAGIRQILADLVGKSIDEQGVLIAIHDAARPFVRAEDITRGFEEAKKVGAAILGHACRDTVKWVSDARVERTIPRDHLFLAETPQVIRGDLLAQAYVHSAVPESPTDDAALWEALGIPVAYVESVGYNGKVTTPADLEYAEWLAEKIWGKGDEYENRLRI